MTDMTIGSIEAHHSLWPCVDNSGHDQDVRTRGDVMKNKRWFKIARAVFGMVKTGTEANHGCLFYTSEAYPDPVSAKRALLI